MGKKEKKAVEQSDQKTNIVFQENNIANQSQPHRVIVRRNPQDRQL